MVNCERTQLSHFHGNNTMSSSNYGMAPFEVHILVVDGDAVSLEFTLGLLASLNYKAEGSKHPLMALEIVRNQKGYFDLIVIEPHFPDFDAFQFKHKLDHHHYSIPFIMMSMENDERVMEKAMKSGVVRYILKPATAGDFKGIWQYAVASISMKRNNKNPTISSSSSPPPPLNIRSRSRHQEDEGLSAGDSWSPGADHNNHNNNDYVRKENRIVKRKEFVVRKNKNAASEGGGENNGSSSSSSTVMKKSKVVWTCDLQSRFLEAINIIGLEYAVPKKILEVMNTPGLTRENVASHLQKYRLFLKRVARMFAVVMNNETAEKKKKKNNKDKNVFTNMASKYPNSLMFKNIKEEFIRMLKIRKLKAASSSSSSSYNKNPNPSSSSYPLFKSPSNKFRHHQYHRHHHHSTNNFSTQMMMNHYGLLQQVPASTSSDYYYTNNFSNNNAGLLGFPAGVSSSTYCDYFGNGNSFNINGSNNYGYSVDGRVSPAASNELFRANQSFLSVMEGNNNNNNNNILGNNNNFGQQENQYGVLNNEGGKCYQTNGVEGNNIVGSLVTSHHCSNFFNAGGFDFGNNNIMKEDDNGNFSNQLQQDNQEAVGEDVDEPRVESNDEDCPSFEQLCNEMLESLNLSEKDLENLNDLELPQDWDDDFMESLLNNGVREKQILVKKMQAIKEKIQDMKTMRSAKAEAKAEEKEEKELAKSQMEIAHETRLAKEAEAEMDLHVAKAGRKAQKELAKHGSKNPNPNMLDPNHSSNADH